MKIIDSILPHGNSTANYREMVLMLRDGKARLFEAGVDFHNKPESFRTTLQAVGKRDGCKISCRLAGNDVQAQMIGSNGSAS